MNTNYDNRRDVLKYLYKGSSKLTRNWSQAYQDLFVLTMLDGKKKGKYLEIGANHPTDFNNCVLLETEYGWKGVSVDIEQKFVDLFNSQRENKCELADGRTFDYVAAFKKKKWKTKQLDYLSLDCEPSMVTFSILKSLPLNEYRFSVITYEHDSYADGDTARDLSRKHLNKYGYKLVAADVCNGNNPYEDWYIDPNIIDQGRWKPFESQGAEARGLFI